MDKYLYEENRLKLAHRAKSFGIAALASSLIMFSFPILGIGLGFLSILFAILSKGYKPKIDKDAKLGVWLATAGIVIGIGVIGSSFYKLYTDDAYRNALYDTITQIYGDEYSDIYGDDFSDMFNNMIGGTGDVDL